MPARKPDGSRAMVLCRYCHRPGHTQRACPKIRADKGRKVPSRYGRPTPATSGSPSAQTPPRATED